MVVFLTLFGAGSAQAATARADLFERPYRSTSVTKEGAPHPLFGGGEIRVDFDHQDGYDLIRWRARCNRLGAGVTITRERLLIGRPAGTDIGCRDALARQDRWLMRFFAADPKWKTRKGRLALSAGSRVVELRRRAERH